MLPGENILSISEPPNISSLTLLGYFIKYHLIGHAVGIYTLYLAVCGHDCIVGASASAKFDVGTFAAFRVHIFFKPEHELPGIGLGKVCHGGAVINISHNIFGHANKTIARVYVSFRANCKGISHTVNVSADCASAVNTHLHRWSIFMISILPRFSRYLSRR